jgi:hypothetical protein
MMGEYLMVSTEQLQVMHDFFTDAWVNQTTIQLYRPATQYAPMISLRSKILDYSYGNENFYITTEAFGQEVIPTSKLDALTYDGRTLTTYSGEDTTCFSTV